jgi:predicted lysophospholipase L1 biosynthesis ABC-type transport system permease subunit
MIAFPHDDQESTVATTPLRRARRTVAAALLRSPAARTRQFTPVSTPAAWLVSLWMTGVAALYLYKLCLVWH